MSEWRSMHYNNIAFIGFGLIGGSIARAIRKYKPESKIYAYANNTSQLLKGKSDGVIDIILKEIDDSLTECDIIFLCAPVEFNEEYLAKIKPFIRKDSIITDVGSTKSSIHNLAKELDLDDIFIGGHPMAGSEKTGYEASDALLLENAYYMITPSSKTCNKKLEALKSIIEMIKSIPFIIDYQKHDKVVATVSHLPHILAATLVNLVKDNDYEDEVMKRVAAGGFKDITRIASASPIMWEQICIVNAEPIDAMLLKYIDMLKEVHSQLTSRSGIYINNMFEKSGEYRNSFDSNSRGVLISKHDISVHIQDKPGAISIISAILAANSISIKNIGINHNREKGEGALNISFYDADSCEMASKLLKEYNYRVI
jgi:prephenate dehydrogenase